MELMFQLDEESTNTELNMYISDYKQRNVVEKNKAGKIPRKITQQGREEETV